MTREKEITKEAKKFAKEIDDWEIAEDVQDAFEQGAEWADAHPHWISVEDELPKINPNDSEWEYSDDVLVALKDGSIAVGWYERDNSTGEHYWMLYGVGKDLVATHWMHKPQSPVLPNSEKTGKNHLIDANNMVEHLLTCWKDR